MNIGKLCIGPMSTNVIDSICNYANKKNKKIMLIASRNQIECKDLGGGYVNNFTTQEYSKYVKKRNIKKNVIMCRDHTGPFLSDRENKISLKESIEKTKLSIKNDINSGFKFIHIDTSMCKNKYGVAEELIDYSLNIAREVSRKIFFEFGTEEHGVEVALKKFKEDISFAKKYSEIKFVVGQTGSLCKEIFQVGSFNFVTTRNMVNIAKKANIYLKEHNGDYLSSKDLDLRKKVNLGSLNVAPQFGVEETKTIDYLANIYGENTSLIKFKNYVLKRGKWKKWSYGKTSNYIKFLSSGHYFFNSNQYRELLHTLNKKVDTQKVVKKNITSIIEHYYNNL